MHLINTEIRESLSQTLPVSEDKHIDKYLYVISLINRLNAKRDKDNARLPGSWVNVYSQHLIKKLSTRRYTAVISHLIDNDYVQRRDSYKVPTFCPWTGERVEDGFAKSYRVADRFYQNPLVLVDYADQRFAEKVAKIELALDEAKHLSYDAVTHVSAMASEITFHQTEAREYVESLPVGRTKDKLSASLASIQAVSKPIQDAQGRLYDWYTSIPSALRPYLSYRGHRLVALDVANSQVLLLCGLLQSLTEGKPATDLTRFTQLCETGQIYKYLMQIFGYKGSRDQFKKSFFASILYSDLRTMQSSRYYSAFKRIFPTVAGMIAEIKKIDAKSLPLLMQKLESNLIINDPNSVVMQLRNQGINCITLHDCVIVCEDDVDATMDIMRNIFADINLSATITKKNWTDDRFVNNNVY